MATKGARTAPPEVSQERQEEAWALRTQGWTQARIAAELDISQQAVSKILTKLGRKFAGEFKGRVEAFKAEHTEILERMVDEALQEFEASKSPLIKTTVKSGIQKVQAVSHQVGNQKETSFETVDLDDEVTVTTEERNGDPRYLAEARASLGDIRKIWGADAPQKTEVETKHSGGVTLTTPTLQKAAEEVSQWQQEQKEKVRQLRLEREAEIAAAQTEE